MRDLTIMTWNVRYFGHGTGGIRATEEWMHRMARAVATHEPLPEVLALQEVETASLRAGFHPYPQLERFQTYLRQELEAQGRSRRFRAMYFPAHRYAMGTGPALYTTGLAMLVCTDIEIEAHNATRPWEITHVRPSFFQNLKQKRIAAHVRLRFADSHERLDVFNTHLSLPSFFEVGPHRVPVRMGHGSNQLVEIENLLSFVRAHHQADHAVVLGDFNTLPDSPVYRQVQHEGLVDAWASHMGGVPDGYGTARFLNQLMHIDHVFSTPALHWAEFQPHPIDAPGPFFGLSDHAPKLGRCRLLPRG